MRAARARRMWCQLLGVALLLGARRVAHSWRLFAVRLLPFSLRAALFSSRSRSKSNTTLINSKMAGTHPHRLSHFRRHRRLARPAFLPRIAPGRRSWLRGGKWRTLHNRSSRGNSNSIINNNSNNNNSRRCACRLQSRS